MQPDAIERCRQEIAAMEQQENAPAWLVTLGITDWQMEVELLNAIETRQKSGCDQQQYFRADQHRQAEGSGSSDRHADGRQA